MGFSDRLKKLRKEKGISQEKLADELNINRTSIVHYENNAKRIPRNQRLQEIADFFGVSVDYLLDRSDNKDYTSEERLLLMDIEHGLSMEELRKKYKLTIDGQPASEEEINAAITFIRSLRQMN
ncbi:helix-turn-helix domain-containing protein [Virgibacillus siamensis]|uniref:helix-turn-helix domain-containing protein n=1 Tax=Virgibacillus siamensis TaxID=480071 RepID=UPI00158EA3BC|nr:helix-turn-helix transcriptional regulator [Virgibacillus siamensis]